MGDLIFCRFAECGGIMDNSIKSDLLLVGIKAAYMLSTDEDNFLVYEHVGNYLYTELCQYYGIDLLYLYVIDEKGESFQQEVICDKFSTIQGYDLIPVEQYKTRDIITEIAKSEDEVFVYTIFPLYYKDQVIGLMELHSIKELEEDFKQSISQLCDTLTVGIRNRILTRAGLQQKQSIDMIIEVTKYLHVITDVDKLVENFARLVVKYMQFDRVTLFMFDENDKVAFGKCIDYRDRVHEITDIPELPELDGKPKPLSGLSGYWFPLATNTRKVGIALFDNIYSCVPFPEWTNDVLLSLCNQFAVAVENIDLFKRVQYTARRDKLTKLYNRAYLEEIMGELEHHLLLSIIFGDVNGLKITNDVFGHLVGDKILVGIAETLQSVCDDNAVIARWGGDEFIIILPHTSYEATGAICNKIGQACEKASVYAVPISITLGYETKNSEQDDITSVLKKAEDMMYYNKQIEREQFNFNFIESLKKFLNSRCDEGDTHIEALTNLAFKFGIIIGLSDFEKNNLKCLCEFHDIGKIGVSRNIIMKEDKLSLAEWDIMKKHSSTGSRIAHSFPGLKLIEDEILSHHERWDGTGYPDGKRALEIPKLSRIFAILDAYVVMTQGRPYKKAISHEEAINEIEAGAGTQFDPSLARLFVRAFRDGLGY